MVEEHALIGRSEGGSMERHDFWMTDTFYDIQVTANIFMSSRGKGVGRETGSSKPAGVGEAIARGSGGIES